MHRAPRPANAAKLVTEADVERGSSGCADNERLSVLSSLRHGRLGRLLVESGVLSLVAWSRALGMAWFLWVDWVRRSCRVAVDVDQLVTQCDSPPGVVGGDGPRPAVSSDDVGDLVVVSVMHDEVAGLKFVGVNCRHGINRRAPRRRSPPGDTLGTSMGTATLGTDQSDVGVVSSVADSILLGESE